MTEYHVVWRIEVTADNPTEAAVQAMAIMQDKDSEALHFEVAEFSETQRLGHNADWGKVDLSN